MAFGDSIGGLLDSLRGGADTWKSLDGGKKSKKLVDALDRVDAALGRSGSSSAPIDTGDPVLAPATPLKSAPPAMIPTWALAVAGVGALYFLRKRF